MNSKKAITLLVLVTLLMGLIPIVPVHAAIGLTKIQKYVDPNWVDWVYPDAVPDPIDEPVQKGDEIRVVGTGVTAGATVNVYWDNAMKDTFTDGTGKVASGTAKAAGTYSIKFLVPEGQVGTHYVWVKDVATGATVSMAIKVIPKLTVSPSSGLNGETITLTGYGYDYNDDDAKGLDITVDLSDFDPYLTIVTSPTTPKTNSLGTWTATFKVPNVAYGSYDIIAEDSLANTATKSFKVGASITLSIKEGPVGSVVTITGKGFDVGDDLAVTIDKGGANEEECHIVSGGTVRSGGTINTRVIIPSMPLDDDEPTDYKITVEDESGNSFHMPTATFTVNGVAEIKVTPSYGLQGQKLTIEGFNFTRISGTEVVVSFEAATASTKFKTDSKGYFKGTITIPAIPAGLTQKLEAETADHDIYASTNVRVGVMLVILAPDSGPSGTLVSLTGVGFDETEPAYTVMIGDHEWFTGNNDAGSISKSVNVPTLEPGVYTVKVIEDESEIEVTASFTVTAKTKVALNPVKAPNTYEVTIEGWYFSELGVDTLTSLEFILYNATNEWILPVEYKGQAVYLGADKDLEPDDDWDDGYFKGKFTVPEDDSIGLGLYTLNVTDGQKLHAQIIFEVVSKVTTISPRKSTFRIGETVAFTVESSFPQENAYIKIMDPAGNQYWRTDAFAPAKWTKIGTLQVYPFYQQTAGGNAMILLEDAPLGTYTWKWYDDEGDLLDSGTFTVAAAAESVLGKQIEDLNKAVTELQTDITTVSTEVAGVRTQITNAINAANAAVQAANAATQAVNAVAQTANAASTAATNAANAATEAKNAANGLTTLVYGAIGASLVAALAAIVSLMQISRRIAG